MKIATLSTQLRKVVVRQNSGLKKWSRQEHLSRRSNTLVCDFDPKEISTKGVSLYASRAHVASTITGSVASWTRIHGKTLGRRRCKLRIQLFGPEMGYPDLGGLSLVYVGRRELWQYLDHMSRDTTNKAPAEEDSYNLLHVFQLQPRNFVPLKG
ncbi:hypothetical protein B0I72DRAFT_161916 [Yarrowia lipolytica]|uniref:Uncharacterized protein n=1 Tax=Yarrowia lipolytica TaxID=4952 RepID=A0A371C2J3_YARLL|nr:hypothetical protein BKA91DRAFT_163867 [Yarrowia lipolytica]KAE8174856.1 hypothetical protein BKA90DRAFT_157497 [Yarrowia lipolytica]KAJ8052012.1 hypothetical protein LXG23DRAFT_38075 [Yarrowia lipolytica]RDW24511.1 hypothetical protein B0I71DRAFT_168006 [Yarrowia lipolytica]RDW31062.1 hypothetical protein B0I72DRAFT_161916 [Yarrowia lipolytica]